MINGPVSVRCLYLLSNFNEWPIDPIFFSTRIFVYTFLYCEDTAAISTCKNKLGSSTEVSQNQISSFYKLQQAPKTAKNMLEKLFA